MKDQLLALAAVRYDLVKVEGLEIRVRELGTMEYGNYARIANSQKDDKGVVTKEGDKIAAIAYLISNAVVDDSGASILSEEEALKVARNARLAMPIAGKVLELSGSKEEPEKHSVAS